VIEIVEVDTPEVEGVIQYWDGSDGKKYPHLHYVCPRCGLGQNVDLLADEPDPRFACCDRCSWDSMVWIRWRNGPTAT
jgi:ribosomal protein S27AE